MCSPKMGMMKARVLPEPVLAAPKMSRPRSAKPWEKRKNKIEYPHFLSASRDQLLKAPTQEKK